MIVFPHAKINLGLNVLRKRPDGFHDIESVLVPIPLTDVLEAIVDPSLPEGAVEFSTSGVVIPGQGDSNLCLRAVKSIQTLRPLPGIRMHLHKVIPTGAGLGGGSSDGAHTLTLLNKLLDLQLDGTVLHQLAAQLGSDCPCFLSDRPQLAQGRGEQLSSIALDLKGWWLLLVNPGIHIGTAEVYANTSSSGASVNIAEALSGTPDRWQGRVMNNMEQYVFKTHPQVKELRDTLLAQGALYSAMSGSGSSVFGIFNQRPALLEAWSHAPFRSWVLPF
ncbi:MAG: 4-(cytidine 5'-diphospho)-2-C-methyl-D-erythritol kinase [Flavobacteriales bacterium]